MTESWRSLFQTYKKFLINRVDHTSGKENEAWELLNNRDTMKLTKKEKIAVIDVYNKRAGYHYSIPTLEYGWNTIRFFLENKNLYMFLIYSLGNLVFE